MSKETLKDWTAGIWLGLIAFTLAGYFGMCVWTVWHEILGLTLFHFGFLGGVLAIICILGALTQWSLNRLGLE